MPLGRPSFLAVAIITPSLTVAIIYLSLTVAIICHASTLKVLKKNQPYAFHLGESSIVPGWDLALPSMSLGERSTWKMGATEGYGAAGKGVKVPPHAGLLFDLELLAVRGKTFKETKKKAK
jgi:hypothetical protein